MDSEFITIAIVDSDQPIETRRCRLVHLPDGTQAALSRAVMANGRSEQGILVAPMRSYCGWGTLIAAFRRPGRHVTLTIPGWAGLI
jgi:hypothetical protein